jgi:CrcB protein
VALVSALAVGVGGSAGALARYAVGLAVERRVLDTLAVNVLGSLLLGVVVGTGVGGRVHLAAAVGFCGAFTTFSSHAVETVRLAEGGEPGVAFGYAVGTLVLALGAVVVGTVLGALL